MKYSKDFERVVMELNVSDYIKELLIVRFNKIDEDYSVFEEVLDYIRHLHYFGMITLTKFTRLRKILLEQQDVIEELELVKYNQMVMDYLEQ